MIRGGREGKGRLRYINDIVVRDLDSLLECKQVTMVGKASLALEGLEDA